MNRLDRVLARLHDVLHARFVDLLPLPTKPKARGPVEHGPTKAPFSREARRIRNRVAERSRARNRP